MIHALTELIATHLADATHGVNALLDAVPVWSSGSGSAAVEDEIPEVRAIYSEFHHDWIAQDKDPPVVPSLTVFAASDADLNVQSADGVVLTQRGVSMTLAVLYVSRHACGAKARREASYTLRAVRDSLVRFGQLSQPLRKLRGVTVVEIARITEQRLSRDIGQGSLAGLVLARAQVVDDLRI